MKEFEFSQTPPQRANVSRTAKKDIFLLFDRAQLITFWQKQSILFIRKGKHLKNTMN